MLINVKLAVTKQIASMLWKSLNKLLINQKANGQLYYVKRQWPNTRYLDTFNIFTDRDYNHRIEPFLGPMGQGIKVTIGCFDKF